MSNAIEFAQLAKKLSQPAADKLQEIVSSADFRGAIDKTVVQEIVALTDCTVAELQLALLPIAASFAKPVLSNFYVGGVAESTTGNLYFGCNLEFLDNALHLSVHAEQSTILNVRHHGETGLRSLAISFAPCGFCRQFINEIKAAHNIKILLPENKGKAISFPEYLPGAFGPNDLGVKSGLFDNQDHALQLQTPVEDELVHAALQEANRSYAPYTMAYSGVALVTAGGTMLTGTYLENVAFNPSATPLIVALAHMSFAKEDFGDIQRVVLVEKAGAKISQAHATANMLRAIAPTASLEIVTAEHL